MISVLIETKNDEERLAKTLASLVTGAVEGLVREVIVCDLGSSDGTETVAEHAGCIFLAETRGEDALAKARSDWVLLLKPGARLVPGWVEAAREHVAVANGPATFSRSRQTELPFWSNWLTRRERIAEGLLMRKSVPAKGRPLRLRAEIHAV